MKKIYLLIVVLFSFVCHAQVDRSVGRVPGFNNNNNNNQNKEKFDPILAPLNYLKKELQLDTFQEAAVKSFMEENMKESNYITSLDISESDKASRLQASFNKMDSQIMSVLNADQKKKFETIKNKNSKKDKKKKDSTDNKEELQQN